jgi:hypothetical protein
MTADSEVTAPKLFKVAVSGPGLNLEQDVDQGVALSIVTLVMGGAVPTGQYVPPTGQNGPMRQVPQVPLDNLSVGEFLEESAAKRNPDKIVAIAAFLQKYRGIERFTRNDVANQFQAAGEVPPGNFPRDFNGAIANRFIAEHQEKGSYYVTRTGFAAIEQKFPEEMRKPLPRSRGKGKAQPKVGGGPAE